MPPLIAQENDDTCALACLRMILADFGRDISEQTLAIAVNKQAGGIDIEELRRIAEHFGLHARIQRLDLAGISDWLSSGVYPIVYLNRYHFGRRFPADRRKALANAVVHAVVVTAISANQVTCNDPLPPGKTRRIYRRIFEAAQADLGQWCLLCERA